MDSQPWDPGAVLDRTCVATILGVALFVAAKNHSIKGRFCICDLKSGAADNHPRPTVGALRKNDA